MTTQHPIDKPVGTPTEKKDNRKRAVAIGLVGLGIAGLAAASAATLSVTAGGTDNVAGGSVNVQIEGPGLTSVHVDLGRTATPDPVWNIDENWPAGTESTAVATLTNFNTSGGSVVAGTYKVAVFDAAISSTGGSHAAIATGDVTASSGTSLTVPLTLGSGATWGDLLESAKSLTVVFEAA